ncbi:MAG TPA: hypothetical protein VG734_20210 [Lacunisphaera sp.]|nr:hypothetical protein [Lacunisphaera sp.]
MPSQLDVAALYGDGWENQDEEDDFETRLVKNAPDETALILGYKDVDDLVQQTQAHLAIDPDHPCLRSLEIWAHGNPGLINDLASTGAATWGAKLKALPWCDNAAIYLAGCNTGLQLGNNYPASRRGPVAKNLADAMAFDPASFAVHLTVFGSAGYLSGCHTTADESTSVGHSTWEIKVGWALPPIWREVTVWDEYAGARAAQGQQVWNPFKNGNW